MLVDLWKTVIYTCLNTHAILLPKKGNVTTIGFDAQIGLDS